MKTYLDRLQHCHASPAGASSSAITPQTWLSREQWQHRMVFTVVLETEAVERVMQVTPAWFSASTSFNFFA